jgi:sugar phosphate isomerase/epimerase
MRFGVCCGVSKAPLLHSLGYDYIEPGASSELVPDQDDAVWAEKRRVLEQLPLPCETFNLFLRGFKITGEAADFTAARAYVHTALARAAQVGGRLIVFGSGGARQVPEGFPKERAWEQLTQFLQICAEASEKTGVVVAIEPLNSHECNILNTVTEGAELARKVGHPGVQNLADSYHMERDGEPLDAILASADVLAHVHTADTGRTAPGTNDYDHVSLFRTLRAAGYDRRVSIECTFGEDIETELSKALAHLKHAYQEVNQP